MRLIDKLSAKKLRELYWQRKMSSPEIAKIYNSTPEHVRLLLRKYKIRIRTKSEVMKIFEGVEISKKELKKLYLNKKVSIYKIAKKFNCCPGTVWNRLVEYSIPIRTREEAWASVRFLSFRKNFSGDLKEKAYLMGFRAGDLKAKARSKTSPTIFIQTNSTKPNLIQLVERLFSPYGHIWKGGPYENGAVCIEYLLNRSFEFLLSKKDLIEPWVLEKTNLFAAYLAGYVDAEGCFYLSDNIGGFQINSEDKNILWQIYSKILTLAIPCSPPRISHKAGEKSRGKFKFRKDVWTFGMRRKNSLLKLIDLVNPYSKHADKRKSMEIVKNNVLERNKKYNNQPDRRFYKLYLEEGVKI